MRAVSPSCGGAAAAPHAVSGGGEGGAAGGGGRRGRRARGGGGLGAGWRVGAHVVCGIHVHPLRHEAGEGGEVALLRRLEKSLLRLRAQPSALSASQEPGGEARARGEASRGAGSGPRSAVWLPWAGHRGGAGARWGRDLASALHGVRMGHGDYVRRVSPKARARSLGASQVRATCMRASASSETLARRPQTLLTAVSPGQEQRSSRSAPSRHPEAC